MVKMLKELKADDIIAMEYGTWGNKGYFLFKGIKPGKYGYQVTLQSCGYYLTQDNTIEKWYGSDREVAVNSLKEEFEVVEF